MLERLSVQLKNRSGMSLKPVTGSSYSVTLKGAYDRNYDSSKTAEGNIYNNKAASFDIAFLDGDNTVQCRGKLDNPEIKGKQKLYKFEKTEGTVPAMYADATGNIYTASGKRVRLGIRPESAERAYPGDDLIPAFTVVYTNTVDGSIKSFDFQAKDSDYIAVYDKKLLWRANLYIEQTEAVLGNIDWNDAHPWNVPPADGVAQEGTCPKSWSDAWGYNEWNRTYDGSQNTNKLSELAAGNGGQVVTLSQFTPLRTIPAGNETNPTAENVIGKTVAYSYPDHPEEGPDDSKGDAGSMDSPFDFVWKMEKQKTLLASAYDISGNTKTASSTTSWSATQSPKNRWNNYKRGSTAGQAYIPGLGLYYGARHIGFSTSFDEDVLPSDTDGTWNWKYTFEAGTDCVGFAQRVASYEGRKYSWWSLPRGIMETGNTDYNTVLGTYTGNRNYPSDKGESNTSWPEVADNIIHTQAGYDEDNYRKTKGSLTVEETALLKERLSKIVPGDIFVKDSTSDVDTKKRDHIAIVAYVPPNASELSASDLMNQIILVEAEYNNKIQSVIKVLSVGDYNNSKIPLGFQIYSNFTTPKTGNEIDLNCMSWAIRRLICTN